MHWRLGLSGVQLGVQLGVVARSDVEHGGQHIGRCGCLTTKHRRSSHGWFVVSPSVCVCVCVIHGVSFQVRFQLRPPGSSAAGCLRGEQPRGPRFRVPRWHRDPVRLRALQLLHEVVPGSRPPPPAAHCGHDSVAASVASPPSHRSRARRPHGHGVAVGFVSGLLVASTGFVT